MCRSIAKNQNKKGCAQTPFCDQQKGRNVLHRVCSGPEGSVETLQWLLEVMPHLKTPEILNEGKNVGALISKKLMYTTKVIQCYLSL